MAGGYTFDADAMADRIRELEDLRDRIRAQSQVLSRVAWVRPPSADKAGTVQAEAAAVSINIAIEHNRAMVGYTREYVARLREAAGRYTSQEGEATGALFE
ncbi:hypothetical protein [Amycolatopsis magusensis]|uniref:hypothetical protein n=1 Tax=Amycolatopsis magusensis TaxID=882444 RepID=UPI0024A934B9|nr:hypothetical protein [Amycolatopsis magusensis]MDI5977328.1 hypothetical protein [Amycolatopsis magusensis]